MLDSLQSLSHAVGANSGITKEGMEAVLSDLASELRLIHASTPALQERVTAIKEGVHATMEAHLKDMASEYAASRKRSFDADIYHCQAAGEASSRLMRSLLLRHTASDCPAGIPGIAAEGMTLKPRR